MSTIAVIGIVAEDAVTRIVSGREVVELRVTEVTNGVDDSGAAWTDDEPLTWTVYVREGTALAARVRGGHAIRVDGRVRNLWGRISIDDAILATPLPHLEEAPKARPF